MIAECKVLCAVQHLEYRRRRISVIVLGKLVYLIKKDNGVYGACLTHCRYDPSGHCADISSAVSSYLSLIAYSAKTHANKLAPESGCDG